MFGSFFQSSRAQGNQSSSSSSSQQARGASRARPAAFETLEGRRLMSVVAFDPAADAGNDAASAVAVGAADRTKFARTETIGSPTDAADYYAFTVSANTAVTVKIGASAKPKALLKQVLPSVQLTDVDGATGFAASKKSGKQTLGPGTYYVAVTGTPVAEAANGVTYKLSIATKPYKKAPAFDSPTDGGTTNGGGTNNGGTNNGGNNNGGGTTTGTNGGTYTGTLQAATGAASSQSVIQYEFTATTAGNFALPGSISQETSWSCVPYNPDGTAQDSGGGGIGDADGKLAVTMVAGQKYVFNILYFGQSSAPYSVTFDASFSGTRLATTQNV